MSPAATRLIAMLKPYTPFAEAIVKRQVERMENGAAGGGHVRVRAAQPRFDVGG